MFGRNLAFGMGLFGNDQSDSIMEFSVQTYFGLTFRVTLYFTFGLTFWLTLKLTFGLAFWLGLRQGEFGITLGLFLKPILNRFLRVHDL